MSHQFLEGRAHEFEESRAHQRNAGAGSVPIEPPDTYWVRRVIGQHDVVGFPPFNSNICQSGSDNYPGDPFIGPSTMNAFVEGMKNSLFRDHMSIGGPDTNSPARYLTAQYLMKITFSTVAGGVGNSYWIRRTVNIHPHVGGAPGGLVWKDLEEWNANEGPDGPYVPLYQRKLNQDGTYTDWGAEVSPYAIFYTNIPESSDFTSHAFGPFETNRSAMIDASHGTFSETLVWYYYGDPLHTDGSVYGQAQMDISYDLKDPATPADQQAQILCNMVDLLNRDSKYWIPNEDTGVYRELNDTETLLLTWVRPIVDVSGIDFTPLSPSGTSNLGDGAPWFDANANYPDYPPAWVSGTPSDWCLQVSEFLNLYGTGYDPGVATAMKTLVVLPAGTYRKRLINEIIPVPNSLPPDPTGLTTPDNSVALTSSGPFDVAFTVTGTYNLEYYPGSSPGGTSIETVPSSF
jgi:hypothetical protein